MNTITDTIQRSSSISFPFLGIEINPPASFSVFGRDIYFYGVIIAVAFIIGYIYVTKNAKLISTTENDIVDIFLWIMPMSIIGARLYFCLFKLDYYTSHPSEIFAIWEGGLAIYGGVIAGIAVIIIIALKKKIKPLAVMDLFLTACILGQAIGRWGNFFNREAFGCETDIFCKMGLTNISGDTIFVHPTFLYESLWNLGVFIVLNSILHKKRKFDGICVYHYCLLYGLGRVWIEGLRTDSLYIGSTNIRVSQVLSLVLIFFGAVMLIINNTKTLKDKPDDV